MLSAIIVAGGSSRRMGFDKAFAQLGGRPVIAHSVAMFDAAETVGEIIVVGREDRLHELREALGGFEKLRAIIAGGAQRQDSVAEGLKQLDAASQFIAVHDGARPLAQQQQLASVYAAAREHGAASLAARVVDTLKRADDDHILSGSVDREHLYAMQTPQVFEQKLLLEAYALVRSRSLTITDEVSAVEALGHKVALVPNNDFNFKITYPADLALAELVLAARRRA